MQVKIKKGLLISLYCSIFAFCFRKKCCSLLINTNNNFAEIWGFHEFWPIYSRSCRCTVSDNIWKVYWWYRTWDLFWLNVHVFEAVFAWHLSRRIVRMESAGKLPLNTFSFSCALHSDDSSWQVSDKICFEDMSIKSKQFSSFVPPISFSNIFENSTVTNNSRSWTSWSKLVKSLDFYNFQ